MHLQEKCVKLQGAGRQYLVPVWWCGGRASERAQWWLCQQQSSQGLPVMLKLMAVLQFNLNEKQVFCRRNLCSSMQYATRHDVPKVVTGHWQEFLLSSFQHTCTSSEISSLQCLIYNMNSFSAEIMNWVHILSIVEQLSPEPKVLWISPRGDRWKSEAGLQRNVSRAHLIFSPYFQSPQRKRRKHHTIGWYLKTSTCCCFTESCKEEKVLKWEGKQDQSRK